MLLQSSGLLWAVVQVLISGSQCDLNTRYEAMRSMQLDPEWTPIIKNACILENSKMGLTLHGVANITYCKENCKEPKCKSIDYAEDGDCRLSSVDTSGPCEGVEREFTSKVEPVCPHPFTLVGDQCFTVIRSALHHPFPTWEAARGYCVYQLPGAVTDLASPKNLPALNEYLIASSFEKVWVGGYNFEKNFNSTSERKWLWMDRKPITYPFTEPTLYPAGNCVYMSNWNNSPSLVPIECGPAGATGFGLVCERYI